MREHYGGKRDNEVEKEATIIFSHVTKICNVVYFKMCAGTLCEHCKGVVEERQKTEPDWHPAKILAPLRHNFYRPYLPELLGDETGIKEGQDQLPCLKPGTYDVKPEPLKAGRNPHKSRANMNDVPVSCPFYISKAPGPQDLSHEGPWGRVLGRTNAA